MLMRMVDAARRIEHRIPSADGLSLYCREYRPPDPATPSAPDVLCVPGLTRNSRDFESLALWLSTTHRVLTPDLRGRGRSDYDPDPRRYQPLTYIGDIATVLQALGAQRVFWIGTSLGGLLAMLTAAMRPGLLAGVVLNDVGPEIDPAGAARIAGYVGRLPPVRTWQEAAAQARLVHGVALPDFTDDDWMRFARCTYRDDGTGHPVVDMDPRVGDAVRAATGPVPDLWPAFRALASVPTLVIRGALSDIVSPETLARMCEVKPDLETLILEGRGHAPTLDELASRAAIRALLDRVSR
jgi:pimeloyl-ACP methyl ester carboxylesterase